MGFCASWDLGGMSYQRRRECEVIEGFGVFTRDCGCVRNIALICKRKTGGLGVQAFKRGCGVGRVVGGCSKGEFWVRRFYHG